MTSRWYLAIPNAHSPATTAFEEGLEFFKSELTSDPKKRARIDSFNAATLQDVLDEVSIARTRYVTKHANSKTRECIVAFSRRVHYYGKVLDVMVQHHAEYASLAWGMMKVVFGAIVEHERLGITIVSAMNDIADALPRIELAELLYPSPEMKFAIAVLYSHIIKFLLRATEWYESSRMSRAVQSITRPAALRYDDLIADIEKSTRKVCDLSAAGSQAEQRDMHSTLYEVHKANKDLQDQLSDVQSQLRDLIVLSQQAHQDQIATGTTLQSHMHEVILTNRDIKASQVGIKHQLSDVQLTQALTVISSSYHVDHRAIYQQALLLRQARKSRTTSKCSPFWTSQRLQAWNASSSSSQIVLRATFQDRLNIRNFCTNVIEQLMQAKVATFWILKGEEKLYSIFDVLKSMIHQALSLDYVSHTDTAVNFQLRKFQAAVSVEDYLNILGELLEHFRLVYVIIDWNAVGTESAGECRKIIATLLRTLKHRGAETIVKVLCVGCSSGNTYEGASSETVLRVGRVPLRKGKRIPVEPLRGRSKAVSRRNTSRGSITA
ncbi:hypothetical protein BKA66DRAFT_454442 [Pyrenochaeta sp. MPI-SDFR-AT-0127]|nr:hypothetical protein BKA66DRAFT_454442 [Pyrenochaeta sp. MPI-SDFR-AT-0127]